MNILVVDDEAAVRFTLGEILEERGYTVRKADSVNNATSQLVGIDVVISDYSMPGRTGLDMIDESMANDPSVPVLMLTAHGNEKIAAAAIKRGAYDYITKPFDIDELLAVIERAHETRRLRSDNRRLSAERALGRRIVGNSAVMQRLLESTSRLAARDVTALVRGETGTGKEFIAELLHVQSPRARAPLIRFNCAALPPDLAEAELFGHVRGAFTGANANRSGYFSQANSGTLILDEVGELAPSVQGKLLRVLQEGEIQPLGSGRIEKVNVRVVSATNRDLAAEVAAGHFREDLYYRLAVVEIIVPPLREHREDIAALATEFARRWSERFGLGPFVLSPALLSALESAPWPGNARQLENAIARMAALSSNTELTIADFASHVQQLVPHDVNDPALPTDLPLDDVSPHNGNGPSLRELVEAFERGVISRALKEAGSNQSLTARRLGVSRVTLIDKLKKYGLIEKRSDS
jgi:DNA-binding NtrC family response regulator